MSSPPTSTKRNCSSCTQYQSELISTMRRKRRLLLRTARFSAEMSLTTSTVHCGAPASSRTTAPATCAQTVEPSLCT